MQIAHTLYRSGSGLPVVLLHAFPVDHHMWDQCAAQLIGQSQAAGLADFPILALDTPGAGSSPVPSPEQTGEQAADGAYLEALDRASDSYLQAVQALGFEQAIWVGLSMGGYALGSLLRRHPDAIAGLVFCDTGLGADKPESRARRLRIAQECLDTNSVDAVMSFAQANAEDSSVKRSPEYIERFSGWIRSQNPAGIAWRERMAAGRPDQSAALASIAVPVALVCGDLDPSSPPPAMAAMEQAIAREDTTFTVLEDCGHFSAAEHPDRVAAAILSVVERLARSKTRSQEQTR